MSDDRQREVLRILREMEMQQRYLPVAKGTDSLRGVRWLSYFVCLCCLAGGFYLLIDKGLELLPVALGFIFGSLFCIVWQSLVALSNRIDALTTLVERELNPDEDQF